MAAAIGSGYQAWIRASQRSQSEQLSFGAFWRLEGKRWRVSWVESTGELYASEIGSADRFIVLARYANKKDVNLVMREWFDGNNLRGLIHKLQG